MRLKGGSIWGGYLTSRVKFIFGLTVSQKNLTENTTLGIPAHIQSEGTYYVVTLTTPSRLVSCSKCTSIPRVSSAGAVSKRTLVRTRSFTYYAPRCAH